MRPRLNQLTLLKSAPSRYTPLTHSTKNVPVTYFSQLCVFSHFEVIIHTQLPQLSIRLCVVTPLFTELSLNKSFFLDLSRSYSTDPLHRTLMYVCITSPFIALPRKHDKTEFLNPHAVIPNYCSFYIIYVK